MLSFTECTSQHWPAVSAFWSSMYGSQYALANNHALFDWQFGSTAGGRSSESRDSHYNLQLALDGEQLVGTLGHIPVELVVRKRALAACWLTNWMVAPTSKRTGVGRTLLQRVMNGFDGVVNVGISAEGQRQFAHLGWQSLGTLTRWVCVMDAARADTLLPTDADGAWRVQDSSSVMPYMQESEHTVRCVHEFSADTAQLWDTLWDEGAGVRRSAALLNWRYAKHPTFRYELFEMRCGSRMSGFAVYRVETVQAPAILVGRIVELVAEEEGAHTLIACLCAHAKERDVAMLDFFCTSSSLDSALRAEGFVSGNEGRARHMPYLFQPMDRRTTGIACVVHADHSDVSSDSNDWYITKGDSDQDRPN